MSASDVAMPIPTESQRYGEVYDRGYTHYDGDRLGRRHAFSALIRYSIQRALGIKKRWTAKVVPIIIYTVAAGTVLIVVGIEAFIGEAGMTYSDFFTFIFALLGLFVATTAPEMLCPDRRENVLTLYFARAITRLDYVLGKLTAMAILTLTVSLAPPALYWLFRQLLADAQLSALKDNADELGKIALVGVLTAFYLGAIGLMISSFTGRKPIAIAIIFVGWVVTETFVGFFSEAVSDRPWSDYLFLFSPARCVGNLAFSLLATAEERAEAEDLVLNVPLDWWWYALSMAATTLIASAVMVWRYVPEK
jgi:ABC-2 type transport system permease protein